MGNIEREATRTSDTHSHTTTRGGKCSGPTNKNQATELEETSPPSSQRHHPTRGGGGQPQADKGRQLSTSRASSQSGRQPIARGSDITALNNGCNKQEAGPQGRKTERHHDIRGEVRKGGSPLTPPLCGVSAESAGPSSEAWPRACSSPTPGTSSSANTSSSAVGGPGTSS